MNRFLITILILSVSCLMPGLRKTQADDVLVFISAFASGEEGAIHAYRLGVDSAQLTLSEKTTDVEHPFFLALSPDRRFLYSIHADHFGGKADEQVAAYKLLDESGSLELLNRQSTHGTASCYLDVDATGKTVVVANYSTGSVASLPVNDDGSLGEAVSFIQHSGSSVNPQRQTGPNAHCIVVSPDNRFVFAADLGIDKILGYQLDASNSQLTPHRQAFVRMPPGAGPRHLTFHPNGQHVYVINELANSVTHFDYDSEDGFLFERATLSTLPEDFTGESYCADVKITPNGRYLYGTNRGHDSIACYRIADDGQLTLLDITPSGGKGPQNLAITSDGSLLLCANMPGNNVQLFRIDPDTGSLASAGESLSITSPSCIMLK
ncbi:MAG: lactonase family protein [Planctomycetaceae bacterium]|nr:lactonase family protein [Planctomycetaceae bacterium]